MLETSQNAIGLIGLIRPVTQSSHFQRCACVCTCMANLSYEQYTWTAQPSLSIIPPQYIPTAAAATVLLPTSGLHMCRQANTGMRRCDTHSMQECFCQTSRSSKSDKLLSRAGSFTRESNLAEHAYIYQHERIRQQCIQDETQLDSNKTPGLRCFRLLHRFHRRRRHGTSQLPPCHCFLGRVPCSGSSRNPSSHKVVFQLQLGRTRPFPPPASFPPSMLHVALQDTSSCDVRRTCACGCPASQQDKKKGSRTCLSCYYSPWLRPWPLAVAGSATVWEVRHLSAKGCSSPDMLPERLSSSSLGPNAGDESIIEHSLTQPSYVWRLQAQASLFRLPTQISTTKASPLHYI